MNKRMADEMRRERRHSKESHSQDNAVRTFLDPIQFLIYKEPGRLGNTADAYSRTRLIREVYTVFKSSWWGRGLRVRRAYSLRETSLVAWTMWESQLSLTPSNFISWTFLYSEWWQARRKRICRWTVLLFERFGCISLLCDQARMLLCSEMTWGHLDLSMGTTNVVSSTYVIRKDELWHAWRSPVTRQ